MKNTLFLVNVVGILIVALASCSVSQQARQKRDQQTITYLKENESKLKKAAAIVIGHTLDTRHNSFSAKEVIRSRERRLLSNFGSQYSVYYSMQGGLYDSTVTFKVINFSGVQEIIYCFALYPADKSELGKNNEAFYKISTTVYYARRPFPFM